ncbi:chemotaxis protein CheW [Roseomonas sp. NAR14]|uniref:Chemotaxis protein CheA n=1 Tax=Roseomonas acroporae TaxID=2937791 RepID=A0A9X1YHU0_9PROT|nr:chemotaxis protein CheW [Roseomonas acroporae]MCK8786406.1 chemotaxis protein CheW [Roseomonas acroporae]
MDDLLADFLTETSEGLAALDTALLRLERTPDDRRTLGEVFRLVHTIKGTCGFLGLPRLEAMAHAAENVLGQYRDGTLAVTPDGITLILHGLDRIKLILQALETSQAEPPGDDRDLIDALGEAAAGRAPSVRAAAPAAGVAAAPLPADGAAAPAAVPVPEAVSAPAPEARSTPAPEARSTPAPEARSTPAPEAPATRMPEAAAADPVGQGAPQSIRVNVEVLEGLMTLVSELVLTRNQLLQLARADSGGAFAGPLQRLSHLTTELQEGVMKTRMQPIGNAWSKLPRLVRDLSQELDKGIELEMHGAETELDRQVLELIKDPLIHMVRNAADHGLESTEARRAAGKRAAGLIKLSAWHEGGHIILEIGDDGRGLDIPRIRAKALAQGLAGEAEIAAMSDREIARFIFHPGFSTAAAVTSVSGRGVGMDVVRTNIERIGGSIDLRTAERRGTTFVIRIPLTLAIVAALIVEAGGERFAVPQLAVVELVRIGGSGARVERIKDSRVMRLRDRLLPLVSLPALLRLDGAATAAADGASPAGEAGFVVVTQVGPHVFGIIVDRVFDTEEIVVKPVAPILRHVTMFSGNTILGDGSVIMILDPGGIARAAGLGSEAGEEDRRYERERGWLAERSDASTALVLFRAGDETPKAVPLGLVARLEDIPVERIELSCGSPVVQYRGRLMTLLPFAAGWSPDPAPGARQAVLVIAEGERTFGLLVDRIVDIIEDRMAIELMAGRPGVLGTAVIAGRVTEIVDCAHFLAQADAQSGGDWFGTGPAPGARHRLLLVEDSAFFRHLVVPALAAEGFSVTAVENAQQALRLREGGIGFDVIVSDIEMPELDGYGFARAVREGGAWAGLPMIALTGRVTPADIERGRAAGFTDYVAKLDRSALLASLRQCLEHPAAR